MSFEYEDKSVMFPVARRREPMVKCPYLDEFFACTRSLGENNGKLSAEKVLYGLINLSEKKEKTKDLVMQGVLEWRRHEKLDFENIKKELKEHILKVSATDEDDEYMKNIFQESWNNADKDNFLWYTFSHLLFCILDRPTPEIHKILERNRLQKE